MDSNERRDGNEHRTQDFNGNMIGEGRMKDGDEEREKNIDEREYNYVRGRSN